MRECQAYQSACSRVRMASPSTDNDSFDFGGGNSRSKLGQIFFRQFDFERGGVVTDMRLLASFVSRVTRSAEKLS